MSRALVLAHSPVLTEADLVDAAAIGDRLAQRAIAIRRYLSVGVCAALAEVGCEEALVTLAGNRTAQIADFARAHGRALPATAACCARRCSNGPILPAGLLQTDCGPRLRYARRFPSTRLRLADA